MGVIGDGIANLATDEVLQRISVVLPCAGEGQYALNTVRAVYESMPANILHEIIVVDDGSEPPLAESFLTRDVVNVYKVTIIRHAQTVGLIGAKKDGGDAATGDIVVFFDCHVAPQPGWHESFLRLIGENYRRIVTPVITDLDVGTWKQRGGNQGQAKCYLTWDADFKWFTSDDPYVPILSGGLLGISKRWWNETGGYDVEMVGWGGENLDQSLRSWLCGGEIMMAQDSFVAHMWRSSRDTRTKAHYKVQPGAAARNRLRAAVAWFGDFSQKLSSFPGLQYERRNADGTPWYGNLDNILEVKTRLGCKSFAWFMNRFKHVYEDGGLIPAETFRIERDGGRCLTYEGGAGTSPDGKGTAVLRPCSSSDERQRWHGANKDLSQSGKSCCSGLRAWNTDQCINGASGGKVTTFVCDISGKLLQQAWRFDPSGQLQKQGRGGFMQSTECIVTTPGDEQLEVQRCPSSISWKKAFITPWLEFVPCYLRDAKEVTRRGRRAAEMTMEDRTAFMEFAAVLTLVGPSKPPPLEQVTAYMGGLYPTRVTTAAEATGTTAQMPGQPEVAPFTWAGQVQWNPQPPSTIAQTLRRNIDRVAAESEVASGSSTPALRFGTDVFGDRVRLPPPGALNPQSRRVSRPASPPSSSGHLLADGRREDVQEPVEAKLYREALMDLHLAYLKDHFTRAMVGLVGRQRLRATRGALVLLGCALFACRACCFTLAGGSAAVGARNSRSALDGPKPSPPSSRLSRRYWQSSGPKPEEETVEGTVIPGLILTALITYLGVVPLTFGVTPEFLVSLVIIAILGIFANTWALAVNMNLPTWIDFQIQKQRQEKKAKESPWPWSRSQPEGRSGSLGAWPTTQFAAGPWIGVELDTPDGKNDGTIQGERYFDCKAGHGIFARPAAVRSLDTLSMPGQVPESSPASTPSAAAGPQSPDSSPGAVWSRRQSIDLDLRSDICVEDRVDLTGVLSGCADEVHSLHEAVDKLIQGSASVQKAKSGSGDQALDKLTPEEEEWLNKAAESLARSFEEKLTSVLDEKLMALPAAAVAQ
ncbi:Pgant2 [Symbiodinium sp. KB8]|nr:Pgant2 [Symbiodinium sp. KB8]